MADGNMSTSLKVGRLPKAGSAPANDCSLCPTPFTWQEPDTIPTRQWLYGRHLMRGIVSLTVAPGGVGKSSLVILQALELVTGRELLGHGIGASVRVWVINLEDDRDELTRRLVAAMKYYGLDSKDIGDRLYLDSGLDQPLMLARESRDDLLLNEAIFQRMEEVIRREQIDVVIIDPFVSAHQVNEADNGKIDRVAKRLSRLSMDCNCAIELVHHTRKLNGMAASSEASRGASSLLAAARSSRALQKASEKERREWGSPMTMEPISLSNGIRRTSRMLADWKSTGPFPSRLAKETRLPLSNASIHRMLSKAFLAVICWQYSRQWMERSFVFQTRPDSGWVRKSR
ncbi:AAA family ATPase [Yoonia algicola]|uniref:AAA family ATPase n=1 Tax=Yoonia algicola TaxID=3137368 RepID=A0AAN0NIM5_9RHOB